MLCPIDQTELVISDRQGVEIDYCPKCRGVWLDRGELDKIIDRAAPPLPVSAAPTPVADRQPHYGADSDRSYRRDDDDDRDGRDQQFGRKKKKRESFLSDLFDF